MRFIQALALAGLSFLSATPAAASEAVLDGVTYALPDDMGFVVPPPHAGVVPAGRLQQAVDRNRAEGPGRVSAEVLFASVGLPGRPTVVLLQEQPPSHPSNARIRQGLQGARYEDGVAVLPGEALFEGGAGKLAYAVRTGLDFAPEAYAICGKVEGGAVDCALQATLGGRLRLVVQHAGLATAATDVMRGSVAAVIRSVLPHGMAAR